jgi:hypothetical protein|tara:strand:+ start:543 stop:1349 length:807 start_codon:yes stop_codon:yes gene_type:complete
MAFKTFYTDFEKREFVKKKILSKYIYPKHFVRSESFNLNSVELVDDNTNLTDLVVNNGKLGVSFFSTRFFFKHKRSTILKFHSFLSFKVLSSKVCVTLKLYESLKSISVSTSSLRLMLILNPIKGGFHAYSCGFLGFLPKSQSKMIFKSFLFNCLKKKNSLSKSLFLSTKNNLLRTFFSISIPVLLTNTVIYPCSKTPNFSSNFSYRKRSFFKNFINFVFITKKQKHKDSLKQYENSTFKKRFKSFPHKNKSTKKFFLHHRKSIEKIG